MAKPKFPSLIHVSREDLGGDDGEYLQVHEEGIIDNEHFTLSTPVAVYKLAFVGTVEVTRRMVEPKRKRF